MIVWDAPRQEEHTCIRCTMEVAVHAMAPHGCHAEDGEMEKANPYGLALTKGLIPINII